MLHKSSWENRGRSKEGRILSELWRSLLTLRSRLNLLSQLLLPQRPVLHQRSVPKPSPSIISYSIQFGNRSFRPPSSLANRLRSSSRFAKGYDAEEGLLAPVTISAGRESAKARTQGGVDPCPSAVGLPSCWWTIYHLLYLYSSMTAASTGQQQTTDVELGVLPRP